jgi:glycosyltransferase involved in cell wall biosynthesis
MTAKPRVSIGMPVYNGERHIEAALDSILSQSYSDFELIVSDNASTDRTAEICRTYSEQDRRIRYFRNEENLGAAKNYNRVFELSSGEYFKWAAHDDVLAPTYVERCVELLDRSGPSVVLCCTDRHLIAHDGKMIGPDPKVKWCEAGPPYDGISFARLMRVPGLLFPILIFGLIRASALRNTRLMGAYSHADLVLVGELRLLGEFRQVPEYLFSTRLPELTPEFRKMRRNFQGEADFYDPVNRRRFLMPEATLLVQRLAAIQRSRISPHLKLWYWGVTLFGQFMTRFPGWVAGRIRVSKGRLWRAWERSSVAAVRRASRFYVPHRIWAFASGLWHLDRKRIALALSQPSAETEAALLRFVADCLCRRKDRGARLLLAEWLRFTSKPHGLAANDALAHHPNQAREVRLLADPCSTSPERRSVSPPKPG